MNRLSMDYYTGIFRNNPHQLPKIKDLLVKDFNSMEEIFFSAASKRDIHAMRTELHRMYPIISNLRFSEMLLLLEKYKKYEQYSEEIDVLNVELRKCLSAIYEFLLASD